VGQLTQIEKEKTSDHGGRDWNNVSSSQPMLAASRNWKREGMEYFRTLGRVTLIST
jgi:hypothetical protein